MKEEKVGEMKERVGGLTFTAASLPSSLKSSNFWTCRQKTKFNSVWIRTSNERKWKLRT